MDGKEPTSNEYSPMKSYFFQLLEVLILLAFIALASILFVYTLYYTMPFVLGILFALLLNPIVVFFDRRGFKRPVSVLTAMILTLGSFFTIVSFIVVKIAQESVLLINNIPPFANKVSQWVTQQLTQGQFFIGQMPPQIVESINKSSVDLLEKTKETAMAVLSAVMHGFAILPEKIVILLIALLSTYFFLQGKERILEGLRTLMPPTWDRKITWVVQDVNRAFIGLIRAQMILFTLTTAFAVVGLLLLQVRYAITFGLLIGVAGFIPVLGTGLVMFPWAGYEFLIGNMWMTIKLLTLQGLIVVMRHVIEPKIFAENVGLDTLSTLIAMYIGLRAFGVFGLFFGPILLIGIRSLLRARMFADIVPGNKINK